jgi:hypothetical protein
VRPAFRNLTYSHESRACRNGLLKQASRLECGATSQDCRFCRLTPLASLRMLGGRNPKSEWARPWDGQWRLAFFDAPMGQNAQRERLRRSLRDRGFGCLQKGVGDFERINRGYARHLKALEERPGGALRSDAAAKALRRCVEVLCDAGQQLRTSCCV